ncbi:MAG: GNAT family N-acetyltransferase [Actinomycetales bacterium]
MSDLDLRYLSVDPDAASAAVFTCVSRAFHESMPAEHRQRWQAVVEPDRTFGFVDGSRWVSTCGAFTRRLTVPGGAGVPTAAVTMVTVEPTWRRRGLLSRMMRHQLEEIRDTGTEPLAYLWAAESAIYPRFGYGRASSRLTLSGPTRAPFSDAGLGEARSVQEVTREEFEPIAEALHAQQLPDRVGALDRPPQWWEFVLADLREESSDVGPRRYLVHRRDGQVAPGSRLAGSPTDPASQVDGVAMFTVRSPWAQPTDGQAQLRIEMLEAQSPAAAAGLWRFLLDLDLVRTFEYRTAVDDPVQLMLSAPDALTARVFDGTYLRVVDVVAALQARRYAREIDIVLDVHDEMLGSGRYRLQGGPDGSQVTRTDQAGDLSLGVGDLGSAYLGGFSLAMLAAAGRVEEHRTGMLARAAAAFATARAPFCPDDF